MIYFFLNYNWRKRRGVENIIVKRKKKKNLMRSLVINNERPLGQVFYFDGNISCFPKASSQSYNFNIKRKAW